MALAGGTGSLLTRNTYDEYGQPGPANAGRFQYTGQAWLPEAQLYHYRARAYAPNLGRFMQTDPIGYAAGANLYAYVGGDPVNWVDPMGLKGDPNPGDLEYVFRCGAGEVRFGGMCVDMFRLPSFDRPAFDPFPESPGFSLVPAPTRPYCQTASAGGTIQMPGGSMTARTGTKAAASVEPNERNNRSLWGQTRQPNGRYASGHAPLRGSGARSVGGGRRGLALMPSVSLILTFDDAVGEQLAPDVQINTLGGEVPFELPSNTYWNVGLGTGRPGENMNAVVTICAGLV